MRPARLLGCAPPCPLVLTHEARDTQHRTSLSSCRAAPVCRYATMGGCMWVVAKAALLAELGRGAAGAGGASVWAVGGSAGAGPCLVVAQVATS